MNVKELTAPCGIACFNCAMYEQNITPQTAAAYAAATKIPVEQVPCKGCRAMGGCRLHYGSCATLDCVKEHGVSYCFECAEFPCKKLMPVRDGADKYPHNLKLYSLCRMQKIGVEQWAQEARENQALYFQGKFVVGLGAATPDRV